MNLRQVIRTDIAASAIAHLSLLALVLLFSEVHPFGSVTAEPIAVDIVTSKEIAEPSPNRLKPTPQPDFPRSRSLSRIRREPAERSASRCGSTAGPARPQKQAPWRHRASATASQRPAAAADGRCSAGLQPPEPDISVKYNVMLGLPPDIS